ncbi:MAG: nucleotidyl transferase AbiEii/AbiGii toxin family protein, partial [Halioglobus sp.]
MTAVMFNREHHQKIHQVLQALDAPFLKRHHCYFGGGTAIVLRRGEYRESVDIDFLVSDIAAYRELRKQLQDPQVLEQLFGIGRGPLVKLPEVRADQYGIRTRLPLANDGIKFEIVFEARILFDVPGPDDAIGGVSTLTEIDLAASKLLANVDRWPDAGVFSRDIIDLAMLDLEKREWTMALAKAASAYGDAVERDVHKAVTSLQNHPNRLSTCLTALAVDVPAALMLDRLKRL